MNQNPKPKQIEIEIKTLNYGLLARIRKQGFCIKSFHSWHLNIKQKWHNCLHSWFWNFNFQLTHKQTQHTKNPNCVKQKGLTSTFMLKCCKMAIALFDVQCVVKFQWWIMICTMHSIKKIMCVICNHKMYVMMCCNLQPPLAHLQV
jgi:hypothetical protein